MDNDFRHMLVVQIRPKLFRPKPCDHVVYVGDETVVLGL